MHGCTPAMERPWIPLEPDSTTQMAAGQPCSHHGPPGDRSARLGLFIVGAIIIVAIKAFIAFVPSFLAAFLVWFFTGSLLRAAIAFIVVAILAGDGGGDTATAGPTTEEAAPPGEPTLEPPLARAHGPTCAS